MSRGGADNHIMKPSSLFPLSPVVVALTLAMLLSGAGNEQPYPTELPSEPPVESPNPTPSESPSNSVPEPTEPSPSGSPSPSLTSSPTNSPNPTPTNPDDVNPGTQPPDIVVILTDDQRAGTERAMPYTWGFFHSPRAVRYPNAQVPTNLCCPSRASLLTGKYSSEMGVWDNQGKYGGYHAYRKVESESLPVWLDREGYVTGLFGKLVNGFPGSSGEQYVPPGWDVFHSYKHRAGYYAPVRGLPTGEYTTDSLGKTTARFIASAPTDEPLFAYYSPYSPHAPYDAGPYTGTSSRETIALAKQSGGYSRTTFNRTPKRAPAWMRGLPRVSRHKTDSMIAKVTDVMLGVDANIRRIVESVAAHRDIDNTLFIFMGDNGYSWGDYGLVRKRNPQVVVNEVPLMVKYPAGIGAALPVVENVDRRLASNVDVTATILDVVGVQEPSSGVSLHRGTRRTHLPLMGAATKTTSRRAIARPGYCGVRTPNWRFVEYTNGERELYNLGLDPTEMYNAAGLGFAAEAELAEWTQAKSGCDLAELRRVETHIRVSGERPRFRASAAPQGLFYGGSTRSIFELKGDFWGIPAATRTASG